jgi:hypothetical protein
VKAARIIEKAIKEAEDWDNMHPNKQRLTATLRRGKPFSQESNIAAVRAQNTPNNIG